MWPTFLDYFFSMNLLIGAGITLAMSTISMALAIVLGLILALIKTSNYRMLHAPADLYIWLFRGTPILLQLIFVFNALPQLGIQFTAFTSAVIALTFHEGAYMAEIIRAGIQSIDSGQKNAARVLGMRENQIMRHVVLPQSMRLIIPPTGNQYVGMLKMSALASVIAVPDLLLRAQRIASANFDYTNTLIAAAAWYLVLTTIFTWGQRWLENKMDVTKGKRKVVEETSELGGDNR